MNPKLESALARLTRILPLKQRQDECGAEIRELHRHILRSFVTAGRICTREELAQRVGNLDEAVKVLRENDMVIFSEGGEPTGAYPFTMETREHSIRVNGHLVHAMCALDALAISPMFGMKTQIASRCKSSGDAIEIRQAGSVIENPDVAGNICMGIDWSAADANARCAYSLCKAIVFLRDRATAERWLAQDDRERETFTLPEAIEFAARFFVPLVS